MTKVLRMASAIAALMIGLSSHSNCQPNADGPQANGGPIYFAHVFGGTVAVAVGASESADYRFFLKQAPYGKYVEFPWKPDQWPVTAKVFDVFDAKGYLGQFAAANSRIGIFKEEGSFPPLLPLEPSSAKRSPSLWEPVVAIGTGTLSCKHFELKQEESVPQVVLDAVIFRAKSVGSGEALSGAESKIILWTTAKGQRLVAAKWTWQSQGSQLVMTAIVDKQNKFTDLYPFEKKNGDALEDRTPFFGLNCQIEPGKEADLAVFAKRLYEGTVFEVIALEEGGKTFSRSSYHGL